jgi:site-specific recombinase XerD
MTERAASLDVARRNEREGGRVKIFVAIDGFIKYCKLQHRSPATIRLYRTCLLMLARFLEAQNVSSASEVTIHHLRTFMVDTQERPAGSQNPRRPPARDGHTNTPATQQSYVKVIKVFFGWMIEEDILPVNPALRLKKPGSAQRIVRTLTRRQLDALFAACDRSTALGFRDFVLMLLLLDTGIRVSELCGLTLDSVHDDHVKILGKGGKEREVGMSPMTAQYLWKYVNQYRLAADDEITALFSNFGGRPLQPSGVEKLLRRAREAAGLDDVPLTAHWFRHTFARTWLEHGGEIMHLSRVMGHSSVKVTEIYLQDFQSRQARLQHTKYSPVGDLKLPKPGRGGRMHAARGMSPSSGERRVGDDEPGGSAIAR